MVELVPVPVVVVPPGVLVKVQLPDAGKPFNTTLPLATVQVGWVIVPTVGAVGDDGWAVITTLAEEDETQPEELVTV
jgi:hypothetical protein